MIKKLGSLSKYGGFVAIAFEWIALLLFYLIEPAYFNGQYAISHFGSLPTTKPVFIICYLGAATTFWVFANYHFKKHFRTPIRWFAFSMLTAAGGAIWPYDPLNSLSLWVHIALAYASFGSFWVGMYLVAKHSDDRRFRLITYTSTVISILIMMAFVLGSRSSYLKLSLEAGSWFICQVWIIWISIRAFNKREV